MAGVGSAPVDLDDEEVVTEWINDGIKVRNAAQERKKRRREGTQEALLRTCPDFVLDVDVEKSDILAETRLSLQVFLAHTLLPAGRRCRYYINPHALPGMPQYNRFAQAYNLVNDKTIQLCYHGTEEKNIASILRNGLDPNLRNMQAYGRGEYFGATSAVSGSYCKGGKYLVLFAILLDPSGLVHSGDCSHLRGKIFVINKCSHQLPIGVIALKEDTLTWSPPAEFLQKMGL